MTRRVTTAVVLAGLVLAVVGCDTDPPPVADARKIEDKTVKPVELKPPVKPAKSEPAAAQLLKEALDAHTGGHPERLDKLKACSFARTGALETASGRWPATWRVDLAWPDRYRMRSQLQMGAEVNIAFGKTPAGVWRYPTEPPNVKPEKQPLDPEYTRTLVAQMQEDAALLLFPLADPNAVAARGPDETLNGHEVVGLHVWTPALDYALLSFDKKTKLLARVVYAGREDKTTVTKEVVVTEHQEFAGVKLAAKMYVKVNGMHKADWNKLDVTPGQTFDPKLFDTP